MEPVSFRRRGPVAHVRVLLTAVVLLAIASFHLAGTHVARAANTSFAIEMRSIAFFPDVIRVNPGDTVTLIVFNNDSGVPHTFDLPAFNVHLGTVTAPMLSGENRSATFVANPAGTYYFHCSIAGHATDAGGGRWTGMAGRLEVGTPPPTFDATPILVVGAVAVAATVAAVAYIALRKRGRPS